MKISVCMATYNGEKYILEQLQSILPQLSCDDELIISDDYSTDKTESIVKFINDPRIVFIKISMNVDTQEILKMHLIIVLEILFFD
ncbi:glycosyltransferase [Shewanella putrefaciens]|nr:glycosyltransferase [Shewanella putrefaciens]